MRESDHLDGILVRTVEHISYVATYCAALIVNKTVQCSCTKEIPFGFERNEKAW